MAATEVALRYALGGLVAGAGTAQALVLDLQEPAMNRTPLLPVVIRPLLAGLLAASPALAQLDEKLAVKALAPAVKESLLLYKVEAVESLLLFSGELEQAASTLLDGFQPDDLEAFADAYDGLLLGLRGDMEEAVQRLADGATSALAAGAAGPLEGALPAAFRLGGGSRLDQAHRKLLALQDKVFRFAVQTNGKLCKTLRKQAGVELTLLLWAPDVPPAFAADETAAFVDLSTGLSIDLLGAVPHPGGPARRLVAAGFAGDDEAVQVEVLDAAGDLLDLQEAQPLLGRWRATVDLPGPAPVVVHVRQGGVVTARALGVP